MDTSRYVSQSPPSIWTVIGVVISFAVLFITIIKTSNDNAAAMATMDNRIDQIELSRQQAATRYEAERQVAATGIQRQLDPLYKMYGEFPVMVQRLTTAEAAIVGNFNALDARVSRIADALGPIRDVIGEVNTNLKLLNQRFEQQFPMKRTESEEPNPLAFNKAPIRFVVPVPMASDFVFGGRVR